MNIKFSSVAVIGLGYVGLPLCYQLVQKDIKVFGIDKDSKRIARLSHNDLGKDHNKIDFKRYIDNRCIEFTIDFSVIKECDAIIICVPTPIEENFAPDLNFIESAVRSIKPFFKKNLLISLQSTSYPGTTRDYVVDVVNKSGFRAGEDIFIVFSSEREDPGNLSFNLKNTPKVIGGFSDKCLALGSELYSTICDKLHPVSSLETAEMSKLLENTYRAVNIALVNDLKKICDKLEIDIFEVINAAKTKPFGYQAFYPGPGVGGHCIPVDPHYLNFKANQLGIKSELIELSLSINRDIEDYVVSRVREVLRSLNRELISSSVLILGLSYKPNVGDFRESPCISILHKLLSLGLKISFDDAFISDQELHILQAKGVDQFDISLQNENNLEDFDIVLILTNHSYFDYESIRNSNIPIVDTRGVFKIENNIFRS